VQFLSRFGHAALVGFLVSSLIASTSYSLSLWLGRNSYNLWWIIYGSVPFALLVGLAAVVQPRRKAVQQGGTILALLEGAALGSLYALIADRYALGGPAFLVLMLSCWVPGAISAMLATASRGKQRWVMTAILCLAAIVLPEPTFNAVTHNQRLTVAFLTPSELSTAELEANPETLGFEGHDEIEAAKNEVLERIRALGYTETFRMLSITRQGKGRESLGIVVVRAPVTKEVVLPVPDNSTVVYVQQSDTWQKNPPQIAVLHRGITMRPPDTFEIPDAQGVSLVGRIGAKAPVGN
jgi:hypothetical protein